jgi:hypothetical protein
VSGQTSSIILGGVIGLLGVAHIINGLMSKLRGSGFWWAGRNLYLDAEEDGDPVGLKTVVWGNLASGVFMIVVGTCLAQTGR